ncbi:hypothetical protein [Rhizobium leguminosarum]|uniref:hypothetical protein n=1 Tax=Rhizobium leguminosarum TaxID=384 RepID=UPI0013BDFDC6|nr:hypothetical protein [Rhizobium leguminosarum]NEI66866.1 hypothetical protein [Rhizobium leguminosarum]
MKTPENCRPDAASFSAAACRQYSFGVTPARFAASNRLSRKLVITIAPRSMTNAFVSRGVEFLGALLLMKISNRFSEDSHRCGWSGIGNGWQCSEAAGRSLTKTVETNHESAPPTLVETMKTLGYGISGLIAFAGLTIGGMVAYASDGAVAALRPWLKIN